MDNYEFKTITCAASERAEQAYTNFYQNLGWEVIEINRRRRTNQTTTSFVQGVSCTTQSHTDWAEIKLRRNRNHHNYEKIRAISNEAVNHWQKSEVTAPKPRGSRLAFFCVLIWPITPFILAWVFATRPSRKKRQQQHDESLQANNAKAIELSQECAKLL